MNYWYTADYHLGHGNIIKYCKRPFKSLDQMNRTIINKHNSRVKPSDIVYHIGDFCFKNSSGGKEGEGEIFSALAWQKQLRGTIIKLKGNHDKNNSCKTNIESMVIKAGGKRIWVTHRPEDANFTYEINLVGHVHTNWKFKTVEFIDYNGNKRTTDLINMGIDMWNFYPRTINEIMVEYHRWKKG